MKGCSGRNERVRVPLNPQFIMACRQLAPLQGLAQLCSCFSRACKPRPWFVVLVTPWHAHVRRAGEENGPSQTAPLPSTPCWGLFFEALHTCSCWPRDATALPATANSLSHNALPLRQTPPAPPTSAELAVPPIHLPPPAPAFASHPAAGCFTCRDLQSKQWRNMHLPAVVEFLPPHLPFLPLLLPHRRRHHATPQQLLRQPVPAPWA